MSSPGFSVRFRLFLNMGYNKHQVQGSELTPDLFLNIGGNKRQVQGSVLTSDLFFNKGCNKRQVQGASIRFRVLRCI